MLAIYCVIAWAILSNYLVARSDARWILHSRKYKAEVLAQPSPADGYLKHIDWEGWGFRGAGDTDVYLVFDPSDSLSTATKGRFPGKPNGLPCNVVSVGRLESHWYFVLFYTDTSWNSCS